MDLLERNYPHLYLIKEQYQKESCPYRKVRSGIDVVNLIIKTLSCYVIGKHGVEITCNQIKNIIRHQAPLSIGAWVNVIHQSQKVIVHDKYLQISHRYINLLSQFAQFRNQYFHLSLPPREKCYMQVEEIDKMIIQLLTLEFFCTTRVTLQKKGHLEKSDSDYLIRLMLDVNFDSGRIKISRFFDDDHYVIELGDHTIVPIQHPYHIERKE